MPQATIATTDQILISVLILLPMACIPAYIAKKKGRSFFLWYLYAFGFFIFALLHSLMISPKQNDNQSSMVSQQYSSIPSEIILNKRRINYCFIGCPMDTLSYMLISRPYERRLFVRLNLFAEKTIKAFDITLEILDSMNGKIANKMFDNVLFSENVDFNISEYPYAMYVNFTVDRIYLENGEEWIKQGEPLEYDIDLMDGYELEKLKGLTNKYAVCLPYISDDYWVCSCSKANNTDVCVLCGIGKQELFTKVNKETVHQLRNDLIRRNNLSKFNLAMSEKQL